MSDPDLWHVKLSEGCVVDMTLDEIDTAFNAGRISARTSVMPPGDFRWTTLGDAAGLEDEQPSQDRATEPAPVTASNAPSVLTLLIGLAFLTPLVLLGIRRGRDVRLSVRATGQAAVARAP